VRAVRIDLLLLAGAFALGTIVAGIVGATNLGTALAFGQMAFAVALVYVLVKRP